MKKHIANMITGFRIPCSIFMLFMPADSASFWMAYLLCGLSDMADGTVARKTGSAGGFGARLDTAADFVFVSAALVKLLPVIRVPGWLLIWMAAIACVRTGNVIYGFIRRKRLASVHTIMNKATGLLLFFLPLTLNFIDLKYSGSAVCVMATLSAVQESLCILKGRDVL